MLLDCQIQCPEHVFEEPWTELEQSNAFVTGCGPCYDNGMWIARDKIELKVHVKVSYRTYIWKLSHVQRPWRYLDPPYRGLMAVGALDGGDSHDSASVVAHCAQCCVIEHAVERGSLAIKALHPPGPTAPLCTME